MHVSLHKVNVNNSPIALGIPLVPKLHLGTHLPAKLSLRNLFVPKYNLGTRRMAGSARPDELKADTLTADSYHPSNLARFPPKIISRQSSGRLASSISFR